MIGIWKSYYIIIRYLVLDTLMELSWAYPATKKAGYHGKLGQSESTNLGAASTATAFSVAVLHADAIDFSIRHLRFLQRLGRFKTSVRSSSSFFGCLRPLSSTKTISNRPLDPDSPFSPDRIPHLSCRINIPSSFVWFYSHFLLKHRFSKCASSRHFFFFPWGCSYNSDNFIYNHSSHSSHSYSSFFPIQGEATAADIELRWCRWSGRTAPRCKTWGCTWSRWPRQYLTHGQKLPLVATFFKVHEMQGEKKGSSIDGMGISWNMI